MSTFLEVGPVVFFVGVRASRVDTGASPKMKSPSNILYSFLFILSFEVLTVNQNSISRPYYYFFIKVVWYFTLIEQNLWLVFLNHGILATGNVVSVNLLNFIIVCSFGSQSVELTTSPLVAFLVLSLSLLPWVSCGM